MQSLNLHHGQTWNGPGWSISTELWTYVVFALLCFFFGLRRWHLAVAAVLLPAALAVLSRSVQWLGRISYSIYMVHFVCLMLVVGPGADLLSRHVVGVDLWTQMPLPDGSYATVFGRSDVEGNLSYAAMLALTLAFSAFTYRIVEMPGRACGCRARGRYTAGARRLTQTVRAQRPIAQCALRKPCTTPHARAMSRAVRRTRCRGCCASTSCRSDSTSPTRR